MARFYFLRRCGCACSLLERPLKADAEEGAASGMRAVDAADFFEQRSARGESIRPGVLFREGAERLENVDRSDEHFAQPRRVADLAGAEHGTSPEADRLTLLAFTDELNEMAFEEEHAARTVNR